MTLQDSVRNFDNTIAVLRRYMIVIVLLNLIWEFVHMPLYTIWNEGTTEDILFAAIHCTGGDALIGLTAIMLAIFMFGGSSWPGKYWQAVMLATVTIGLGYTVFSEWLNIVVREAWAYRDIMPVVPILNVGLSPLLQWIVIPIIAFQFALKPPERRTRHA